MGRDCNEPADPARLAILRSLFTRVYEDLSVRYPPPDFQPLRPSHFRWRGRIGVEYQERLDALKEELIAKFNEINHHFLSQLQDLEPYVVRPSYSQLEVVSRGFIWR